MIKNKTRKTILSRKYRICKSFFSKALGLMFRSSSSHQDMLFKFDKEQNIGIHMFFVFYPIDVIWLDKNFKVVDAKTLRPFTFYNPKRKAKYVIELREGMIKKRGTITGDDIEMKKI